MPTTELSPAELLHQRSIPEMVLDWTEELVTHMDEDYNLRYPNSSNPVRFSIESGRKYLKINNNHGGVHAFVDKKTGQVYKPASYKAPAKHVRYDLRLINDRARCYQNADWAGGYLYLRG